MPFVDSQPPQPMITAVPAMPAYSTTGKYFAEIFTRVHVRVVLVFVGALELRVNALSRPNACTTRTPSRLSCSVERFVEMRSRTSRYALFDTRRNQRLAKYTGGTITSTPSASCHEMYVTRMTAPTNRNTFCTNSTRPCEISSCSASMSEVMRATIRPVFSVSK